ncbi:MAG: septal ring lytic transglycosylase RlpA family protein [Candidatus Krumholzibacteria bacterium]|nr:septal ring lytic transglycosylase RlpA family protein [Candidatus Krumholzibacteria bacterium]
MDFTDKARSNALLMLALVVLAVSGCGGGSGEPGSEPGSVQEGEASYYAHKFHGRTTANGEIYDENKMTAAHKTLSFGTTVRVTNLVNGKKVVVRINDRGPFVKGRIIDLSYKAAGELDYITRGVVKVRVEVLK